MNAGELKLMLLNIDDETEVRIFIGETFWPVCYQDTSLIQTPLEDDVFMICPCYGHGDDVVTEEYHANDDEIIPN